MTIASDIEKVLTEAFAPTHLSVENESHTHAVPKGAETHFRIVVVSESFAGQSTLARHRALNAALSHIVPLVRAMSYHTLTPHEFSQRGHELPGSPRCAGHRH